MDLEYRKQLMYFNDELHYDNYKILKFLCEPLIGGSGNISSPMDIFEALEKRQMLSRNNMSILYEAFTIMQRFDIVDYISCNDARFCAGHDSFASIDPFRVILTQISESLSKEDVNKLRFVYSKIPKSNNKVIDGIDLFKFMMQRGDLKSNQLGQLKDLLSAVDRQDLSDDLCKFEGQPFLNSSNNWRTGFAPCFPDDEMPLPTEESNSKNNYDYKQVEPTSSAPQPISGHEGATKYPVPSSFSETGNSITQPFGETPMDATGSFSKPPSYNNAMSSMPWSNQAATYMFIPQQAPETLEISQGMSELQIGLSNNQPDPIQSAREMNPADGLNTALTSQVTESNMSERGGHALSDISGATASSTSPSAVHNNNLQQNCYKMTSDPRGLCVIINIENFTDSKFIKRQGSQLDRDSLKQTFTDLKFYVEIRNDPQSYELERYLEELSDSDHSSYDCFVMCILSHGSAGYINTCEGDKIHLKDIFSHFKAQNCPTLAGKPKLFFMACCQGTTHQPAVRYNFDEVQSDGPDDNGTNYLPDEADFLFGFATVPGSVSYRSVSSGTWYIKALTDVLKEFSQEDILDILREVNNRVADKEYIRTTETEQQILKQIPAPQFTLRKKLKFFP